MTSKQEPPQLTFNREILGVEQPAGVMPITEEIIRRYAELLGQPLEAPPSGQPLEAPFGLLNAFSGREVAKGAGVKLEGADVGLYAGRAIEVFAKVHAGDILTRTAILQDVYTKTGRSGTMAFEVWDVLLRNQEGMLVARTRDSMVYRARGGTVRSGD